MYNEVITKRLCYMAGIQKDHLYVKNISIFQALLFAADISTCDASREDRQCLNKNVQPLPILLISSATSMYLVLLANEGVFVQTYCHYSTKVNVALF